jgi:glycerol kinase
MKYILSIDQSTSMTKAFLIDKSGKICFRTEKKHAQFYPKSGWVEHDAMEIYRNVCVCIRELTDKNAVSIGEIEGLCISNQRETTVVWDAKTGDPVCNAIVWQCQRGSEICKELSEHADMIRSRTGLTLSPYYPAAKIAWVLKNIPEAAQRAKNAELLFGTIDSFLLYRLSGGKIHITDITNASRSQLFNLKTLDWDKDICAFFDIPISMLPKVAMCDGDFGQTESGLPVLSIMGDSHSALLGHGCVNPGSIKVTYGTGSSIMQNIGSKIRIPKEGISLSVAYGMAGKVIYSEEGNVTCSGDIIKWLQNEAGLIGSPKETESIIGGMNHNGGVYMVPAFSGLGAPYFDSRVRAAIMGISRGTTKAHIVRAAIEAIAFQIAKVISLMNNAEGKNTLYADGGAAENGMLMQFQADVLGRSICVGTEKEVSALGTAFCGGLKTGFFTSIDALARQANKGKSYSCNMDSTLAKQYMGDWERAVAAARLF